MDRQGVTGAKGQGRDGQKRGLGIRLQGRGLDGDASRDLIVGRVLRFHRIQHLAETHADSATTAILGTDQLRRCCICGHGQDSDRRDGTAKLVGQEHREVGILIGQTHRRIVQDTVGCTGDIHPVASPLELRGTERIQLDVKPSRQPFHGGGVLGLTNNGWSLEHHSPRDQPLPWNRPFIDTIRTQPAHGQVVASPSLLHQCLHVIALAGFQRYGGRLLVTFLGPLTRRGPAVDRGHLLTFGHRFVRTQPKLTAVIGSNPERVVPRHGRNKIASHPLAIVFQHIGGGLEVIGDIPTAGRGIGIAAGIGQIGDRYSGDPFEDLPQKSTRRLGQHRPPNPGQKQRTGADLKKPTQ